MQEPAMLVGGRETGTCRPTAPGEELGFGLPQRRRGRLAVQVLRGDRAPLCARAQLTWHHGDDAVHPPDQTASGGSVNWFTCSLIAACSSGPVTIPVTAVDGEKRRSPTTAYHCAAQQPADHVQPRVRYELPDVVTITPIPALRAHADAHVSERWRARSRVAHADAFIPPAS